MNLLQFRVFFLLKSFLERSLSTFYFSGENFLFLMFVYVNQFSFDALCRILIMLAIDPTKKLSFQCMISNGDLVIVYARHDNMKAVKVCDGSELQN